jgi:hypothetical protein
VFGLLLLDKPGGITSNRALQRAKRLFGAAKAGHADPSFYSLTAWSGTEYFGMMRAFHEVLKYWPLNRAAAEDR